MCLAHAEQGVSIDLEIPINADRKHTLYTQ